MFAFGKIQIRKQQLLLLIGDLVIIIVLIPISFYLRGHLINVELNEFLFHFPSHLYKVLHYFTGASLSLVLTYISVFYIGELYNLERNFSGFNGILRIGIIIAVSALIITTFYYFFGPSYKIGRGVFTVHAILLSILVYLWRFIFSILKSKIVELKNILVIGAGEVGRTLVEEMNRNFSSLYRVIGFVDDDPRKQGSKIDNIPVVGTSKDIRKVANENKIDVIVFAILHGKTEVNGLLIKSILDLKSKGIDVFEMPTFYKKVTGKVPVKCIEDTWLLFSQKFLGGSRLEEKNIKRLLDVGISALCLAILSPLLLIAALLIKLTSKGPIFYKQRRVGLNKKLYKLVKFRTMVANAEENGPVWASKNDPRVTFIGRFLRRTRIDEIPQFINILKGDMSIVGPRPERPNFVDVLEKYIPYYSLRFSAKPGLTGWAQVNYQYGASVEDAHVKLQYDIYYIQDMSILLDLTVMMKTLQTVFFHHGS